MDAERRRSVGMNESLQLLKISCRDDIMHPSIFAEDYGMPYLNYENIELEQKAVCHSEVNYLKSPYFSGIFPRVNVANVGSGEMAIPVKEFWKTDTCMDTSCAHALAADTRCLQTSSSFSGAEGMSPPEKTSVTGTDRFADEFLMKAPSLGESKFILFDQDGSRRRIIVPPSQCSMPLPISAISKEGIDRDPYSSVFFEHKEESKPYHSVSTSEEPLASAFVLETKECKFDGFNGGIPANHFDASNRFQKTFNETSSQVSCNNSRQAKKENFYSLSHEDTEDIDALLSDDEEEISTGRSPSDMTEMDGEINVEDTTDVTSGFPSKKRKLDEVTCGQRELNLMQSNVAEEAASVKTSELQQCTEGENNGNLRSFRSSIEENIVVNDVEESQEANPLEALTFPNISRREKIRRTVEVLKSIIPGGDYMDTPFLLDEAIRHVKVLQQRVKLLETEVI